MTPFESEPPARRRLLAGRAILVGGSVLLAVGILSAAVWTPQTNEQSGLQLRAA